MKLVKALLVSLLIVQLHSGPTFSKFKSLNVSSNVTHILFYSDLTKMMGYTSQASFLLPYVGYSYAQLTEQQIYLNPSFITTYKNVQGDNIIIYGSADGLVRQRIQYETSWSDRDFMDVSQYGGVKYIQVSSDGKYCLVLVQGGEQVYIQSLVNTSQPYKVIDYKGKGVVNVAKWIPATYQLAIGGGNSAQARYFDIYDLELQTTRNFSHITFRPLVDLAIQTTGNTIYMFQADTTGHGAKRQANTTGYDSKRQNSTWILTMDWKTEELGGIEITTNNRLTGINVRGNFLEVYDSAGNVQLYNTMGSGWHGSYPTALKGYGLSPDGSDLVTLDPLDSSKLVIYRLCMGFSDYFSSQDNICKRCNSSCLHCFFQSDHCSQCRQAYYKVQWSCLQCAAMIDGCLKCQNGTYCTQCDFNRHYTTTGYGTCQCLQGYYQVATDCLKCMSGCQKCVQGSKCQLCTSNWILQNQVCVCPQNRLKVGDTCYRCEEYMQQCDTCATADVCLTCRQGYQIDSDTHKCIEQSYDNMTIIIIVAVVVPIMLVGGFLVQRYFRKRRERLNNELLTSDQSQPYRRAEYS